MAHHKRRRPKHRRAGCLLCKRWKDERGPEMLAASDERRLQPEDGEAEATNGRGYAYPRADWPAHP